MRSCSFKPLLCVAGVLAAASTLFCGSLYAQPAVVTLSNGTRVHGTIIEQTPETIRIMDPVLGELAIPRSSIVAIIDAPTADQPAQPAEATKAAPEPAAEEVPGEAEPEPDLTGTYGFLRGWAWEAEIGLNGSEGNTEQFNLRTALNGERESDRLSSRIRLSYNYATDDGEKSEDRFLARLRNDWKFRDSKWRFFTEGEFEYDDFQDWDWRWSAFAGPAYAFIENDRTLLLGRVGFGFNQFVGGENDDVSPQALIGLQYNHKFTDRQSFESEATLFPDLDETGEYRFVGTAAYSILVDPEINMSLRLGIENRYNSNPGGNNDKNDLDYFLTLVWAF